MKIRTLMEEQGKEQALFLKGVKESCFLKDYIKVCKVYVVTYVFGRLTICNAMHQSNLFPLFIFL